MHYLLDLLHPIDWYFSAFPHGTDFTIDPNRLLSLKKVLHCSDKYYFSRLTLCLSITYNSNGF